MIFQKGTISFEHDLENYISMNNQDMTYFAISLNGHNPYHELKL